MASQIDIHLPHSVLQPWQNVKYFVNESFNSLTNSAHQVGESLKATATTTTNRAIDTFTTTLEQSWQTAEQIKSTTSEAVKVALASSASDWLVQHPVFLQLVQILGWAANHPIISLVALLFILALLWSIIKAIAHLIETASWSIIQVPLKLIQALIGVSFLSLTKVGSFTIQRFTGDRNSGNLPALLPENSQPVYQDKQQRLAEISSRLEAIHKEQHELLQEAEDLIASIICDVVT